MGVVLRPTDEINNRVPTDHREIRISEKVVLRETTGIT